MEDPDKEAKPSKEDQKRTEQARQIVKEEIEEQRALIEKIRRKMDKVLANCGGLPGEEQPTRERVRPKPRLRDPSRG
ncbi:hypothetical protein ACVWWI_004050 [Bradyrhizobium sp. USDA 3686]|uniref:hypothetical protein n=1 Tax=Bradyrhizobium canariense TaxID=255045 RepID=UPI0019565773|nr:hypothetical protein [Bradyrhizobium canariense]MBM7482637.1 hypothetical protein [Bradyrhizobium canariense]